MILSIPGFPEEINDYIKGYAITRHPYHETADIYVLKREEETIYLKTIVNGSLTHEYQILKWINGRIPVREPIKYLKDGATEYPITSGIEGTPVYQLATERREDGVKVLAEALKMIHSLDTKGCPQKSTIDDKIILAKNKAGNPLKKRKLAELENTNVSENIMFTHGDYCLPNILVTDEGALGGVIDWDYGGLADQYVDFVSCLWSLNYNFGEGDWGSQFLKEYGVELDWERFGFFRDLIDLID